MKPQSTPAATDFDFKNDIPAAETGGAAEVYTMPGCCYCQQVCCYQMLLPRPPAQTQHRDATGAAGSLFLFAHFYFFFPQISFRIWASFKIKAATTPSWRPQWCVLANSQRALRHPAITGFPLVQPLALTGKCHFQSFSFLSSFLFTPHFPCPQWVF